MAQSGTEIRGAWKRARHLVSASASSKRRSGTTAGGCWAPGCEFTSRSCHVFARTVCGVLEGYAPGYAQDAMSMMAGRGAPERAEFSMSLLHPEARVLDVGCGPG